MLFGYLKDMIKRHDSEEEIFFISFSKIKLGKISMSKSEGTQSQHGQDNILLHRVTVAMWNVNVTYCTA